MGAAGGLKNFEASGGAGPTLGPPRSRSICHEPAFGASFAVCIEERTQRPTSARAPERQGPGWRTRSERLEAIFSVLGRLNIDL